MENDGKTAHKIGIYERRVADTNEFASDMAVKAAEKLFQQGIIEREEIDFLIYCTQSPDYILPSTACLIQNRLKLPTQCGAFDYNLGCSGYVYGLAMAKGFIESGVARNILLITSDTYSKYLNENDRSVYPIFGDAATATLISSREHDKINIGPFVFGSDGSGAQNLIIPAGGFREPVTLDSFVEKADEYGNIRNRCNLYMNGPEIFNFTLREIPPVVEKLLEKSQASLDEYDYFVFHQANLFMLEHLRKKLKIDAAKFSIQLSDIGNTVSSSIPIALKRDINSIQPGSRVMLVGFGVGYSWAACSIRL